MHRMPRLTLFLAAAALAAAPASLRAQPGGTTPSAQPARPVDECGKPGSARPRPRRSTPAAPARPPRLLGTPVGGSAASADSAQTPAAGSGAASGSQPATTAAGSGTQNAAQGGSRPPRLLGTPVGESAASADGSQAQPAGSAAAQGSPSSGSNAQAGGTGAAPGSAGSPASGSQPGASMGGAQQGAPSTTGAAPQASSTSVETAASSTSAGSQFLAAGASRDRPVDPASAQRNRDAMRLGLGMLGDRLRLGPAASVSVPTAFGVDAGELFLGVAYQGRTRYTEEEDGAAVIGFGVGTRRVVALEAALTTYSTFRGEPFETGGMSFKLHRALPAGTSVAVGWENAILWGGSDDDGSLYGVVTKLVNLRQDPDAPFNSAVFTVGVGNGRFRFEEDDAEGKETVNLFAAAGARVTPQVSLVADWTGQDLNAAASLTPLPRVPVVITVGMADITGLAGDGARFILSLGYGLAFRQPSF